MRYAWIERHRNAYPVGLMFESLGVSKSGWYAARRRTPSQRAEENARLVTRMQSLQRRHRGRYGRRRMHRALRGEVGVINEKRGRLMRQHGLQSRLRRRFRVVTTDSRHAYPIAPNVLARDFEASAPDRKCLVDLTFVATDEGWLYLALVHDLFIANRRLGGQGFEVGDSKRPLATRACSKPPGTLTQSKNHAFELATAI